VFKVKEKYIFNTSTVDVEWNLDSTLKHLFLWYPVSWLPWKNYTPIFFNGKMSLLVSENKFHVEIKQLHFWGFKSLYHIIKPVHSVKVKNIDSKLQLIKNPKIKNRHNRHAEIASLFFSKNLKKINTKITSINPKIKTPSIKNILPIQ
jgi:hypothetical protein